MCTGLSADQVDDLYFMYNSARKILMEKVKNIESLY